jgi:hypothetical protein
MCADKYVRLEPIRAYYEGQVTVLAGRDVLIRNGDLGYDVAWQLYPQQAGIKFAQSIQPVPGVLEVPILDPRASAGDISQALYEFKKFQLLARASAIGKLCNGGTYHWQIYGSCFQLNPNEPYNCIAKQYLQPDPCLIYDYYSAEIPQIETYEWTQTQYGCAGHTYQVDRVANKPPEALYQGISQFPQMDKLFAVCLEQMCPGVPGGYHTLSPITEPVAIDLPGNVDYPQPQPATNLYAGTITNVGNTQAGYVELVPYQDGYKLNLGVPCPCQKGDKGEPGKKGDKAHPIFEIEAVYDEPENPPNVWIREMSEDHWMFSFNIPGSKMKLVSRKLPIVFPFGADGEPHEEEGEVWIPADDKHDTYLVYVSMYALLKQIWSRLMGYSDDGDKPKMRS